jgi:hypothetical protein
VISTDFPIIILDSNVPRTEVPRQVPEPDGTRSTPPLLAADIRRLQKRVAIENSTKMCWPYVGGSREGAYGPFSYGPEPRRYVNVAKLLYEIYRGEVPDGYQLRRLCRNSRCCSPFHRVLVVRRKAEEGWRSMIIQKRKPPIPNYRLDEVLAILDDVSAGAYDPQTRTYQYRACCPAHADHDPSFGIAEGEEGNLLLQCYAGCDYFDMLEAIYDLLDQGVPNGHINAHGAVWSESEYVKRCPSFDYYTADNLLSYRAHRKESTTEFTAWGKPKKICTQDRPDPDRPGQWIPNLDGVKPLLYHLPQLLAEDPEGAICVVEGEPKVELLTRLRFIATCNSGGANNWSPELDLSVF